MSYLGVFETPYLHRLGLNTTCQARVQSISQSGTEGFTPDMIGGTVLRKDKEN